MLTVVGLVNAPDRIPIHWNAKGEVDGWSSKWVGLLIYSYLVWKRDSDRSGVPRTG